ncbi:MAG: apolipoprotein N-acyltransferase [Pseudomonadota bacterium]
MIDASSPSRSGSSAVHAIGGLSAWRARAVSAGAGVLAATAFAPFYLLPLMAVGYSALVFLIDRAAAGQTPVRSAFGAGWLFGFGFHLVGLHWLAFAFMVQAEEFAWMAPFAIVGMAAFLGLFFATAAAAAAAIWRPGPARAVALAALVALAEYARGHALTGLPWNLPAQALAGLITTAQTAAWVGPYGLSFLALLMAVAPAAFAPKDFWTGNWRARFMGVSHGAAIALTGYAALFGAGAARLGLLPAPAEQNAHVRIVQPNIPQREKIDPDLRTRNIAIAAALSKGDAAGSDGRLFVIWPENAAPLIDEDAYARQGVAELLPQGANVIAGAVRRAVGDDGRWRVYNSISLLRTEDGDARVLGYYDKHHLAPFGEYLPLRPLITALGLSQLAPYDEGFTAGSGPARISLGGPSFAPLICYETIFPGALFPKNERPDWLVVVTNDAWFGDAAGPRQHLDQARLRAIETGLPMARAANTGISALIDADGRYLDRIELYRRGVIDAPLPGARKPTVYATTGDWPILISLMGLVAFCVWRSRSTTG